MKNTLKIIGLLILGAVLGYALLLGVSIFRFTRAIKKPGFLAATTMQGTDPHAMSNPSKGSVRLIHSLVDKAYYFGFYWGYGKKTQS